MRYVYDSYVQCYSDLIGSDPSSDPRTVSRNRLAQCVNMWRDYDSEHGAAIETFPGFRSVWSTAGERIKGIYALRTPSGVDCIIAHAGIHLYVHRLSELCAAQSELESPEALRFPLYDNVCAFTDKGRFYAWDGTNYWTVFEKDDGDFDMDICYGYIPLTYYNGNVYEQRNMLINEVEYVYTNGGEERDEEHRQFPLYDTYTHEADGKGMKPGIVSLSIDGRYLRYVSSDDCEYDIYYDWDYENNSYSPSSVSIKKSDIYNSTTGTYRTLRIVRYVDPIDTDAVVSGKRAIIGNIGIDFEFPQFNGNSRSAIIGCTRAASYDGRIFVTGNPEYPNTVFYTQRNRDGVNDPSYFGVYNYFNDGDGGVANVDILSSPSMLAVIKSDTIHDGSIYYHFAKENTDSKTKNLIPRLYPSTEGAAGTGAVCGTGHISCNFADDLVFLSRRGLEAVGKETVNLERTLTHRSSNVDRLLTREDLGSVSMAEWLGYLVICCNGRAYLADSRYLTRHTDGSYQYEWYCLDGLTTYERYAPFYAALHDYPFISSLGISSGDLMLDGLPLSASIDLCDGDVLYSESEVTEAFCSSGDAVVPVYYVNVGGRRILVGKTSEREGLGEAYPIEHVLSVGDILLLASERSLCIVNTDRRGVAVGGSRIESDEIDASYYSFNGVRYYSGCSLRLDDCDKKSVLKNTVCGTVNVRFKSLPQSRFHVQLSLDGRHRQTVAEVFASRADPAAVAFRNMSFTDGENGTVALPEVTRGWINKQYYFYSDGFCEPFGLYELSFTYTLGGKIRS